MYIDEKLRAFPPPLFFILYVSFFFEQPFERSSIEVKQRERGRGEDGDLFFLFFFGQLTNSFDIPS